MSTNVGFKATGLNNVLARAIARPGEKVVVHHIWQLSDNIMASIERRRQSGKSTEISFERVLLSEYGVTVLRSHVHTPVDTSTNPLPASHSKTARWSTGTEELTVTVTGHFDQFEYMIRDNNKMKFIGWE